MWIKRLRTTPRRRGVAILAFTVVLTVIASITAMMLSSTLMDHSRINERRRALWRAFLHAEAGIAQVQHWAMHPDDYTANTNLWVQQTGASFADKYPALESEVSAGGFVVAESDLDFMGITGFTTETGWNLGRIEQIEILPLDGTEPASAAGSVFKIVSLGSAGNPEVQREVIGYATLEQFTSIELPAPLISMNTAQTGGNPKIHWGEAWSRHSFNIGLNSSKNGMGYIFNWSGNKPMSVKDALAKYRTEGTITFSNWKSGSNPNQANVFGSNANKDDLYSNYLAQPVLTTGDWTIDGRRPGLFSNDPTDSSNEIWSEVFYTHVPQNELPWPDLASEYDTFKALAQANGRYYTTNASNQLLKDGNVVDFDTEFQGQTLDLVFIDTINQEDPADHNYTNLATISVQGNSQGLAGFFYVNANFAHQGQGNPPSVTAENPNTGSDETISKVWLDGVLYTAGTMDFHGNTVVYGSCVTEGGFVGQGTPDIYYNTDLADGLDLGGGNLGSPFTIQLHNNEAP